MNAVIITGRIANDIELKTTTSGRKNAKFTIAIKRDKDNTDFIDCVCWEQKADFLKQYFEKGKAIEVYGELRTDKWEKDGEKRTKTYVLAQRLEFALTEKKVETTCTPIVHDCDIPF